MFDDQDPNFASTPFGTGAGPGASPPASATQRFFAVVAAAIQVGLATCFAAALQFVNRLSASFAEVMTHVVAIGHAGGAKGRQAAATGDVTSQRDRG
ncbi:MAG: hypothetical protein ACYC2H_01950 [Thermoplasmatota archaeon]